MIRVAVDSSNLASVGWEPGPPPLCGTLEIEFMTGAVYRYAGVSATTAFQLITGGDNGSVGRAFHVLIRKQGYPFVRVT